MIKEEYRVIPEFPDYKISNMGNVMSLYRNKVSIGAIDDKLYHSVGLFINGKLKLVRVQRLMLKAFPENFSGKNIIHIDKNRSNNELSNLKSASSTETNQRRRKMGKPASSMFKGVCESKGKVIAQICKDKKNMYIGTFKTHIEAAKAYDEKARELFGEFANLNFKGSNGNE